LDVTGATAGMSIRLTAATVSQTVLPSDQNLSFQISAVDGDGDTTTAQSLNIHVVAGNGSGNFTLTGTAGDDVIAGSTHTDAIAGSTGFDIADYTGSAAAISIHLADVTGNASGTPGNPINPSAGTIGGGDAAGDTLTGIEGLIGGSGNDYLFGNASANHLDGGSGNDTLNGFAGNDLLIGGDGNDLLIGGLGHDTLTGGTGADTFKLDSLDIKDLITDYSGVGGQGDVVDLTALFDAAGGNVGDFVNFNQATGTLSVDANGSAGGGPGLVDAATLTNLPVASTITLLYHDGATTHTITADQV
jgi:Ca2+-binding RTX toxin-like protein